MVHAIKRFIFSTGRDYKNLWYLLILNRIGTWLKKNKPYKVFKQREDLYRFANSTITMPILYLEFGVYKGESIKYWVEINKHPQSVFYGFDTFSGLPEHWSRLGGDLKKGTFDVQGQFPQIGDNRVHFQKGLFQDTLPTFTMEQDLFKNRKLFLHLDADLYSSTMYVLCYMNEWIKAGTLIIFDEFTSGDEYMAFENYISSFRREYKVLGVSGESYQQVLIEITK